jgi:hypothetical protein
MRTDGRTDGREGGGERERERERRTDGRVEVNVASRSFANALENKSTFCSFPILKLFSLCTIAIQLGWTGRLRHHMPFRHRSCDLP